MATRIPFVKIFQNRGGRWQVDNAEERGQVGHESRSKEAADDAHAHAKGPEHGDGRVFAHIFLP